MITESWRVIFFNSQNIGLNPQYLTCGPSHEGDSLDGAFNLDDQGSNVITVPIDGSIMWLESGSEAVRTTTSFSLYSQSIL